MDFVIDKLEVVDKTKNLVRMQLVPDPRVWRRTKVGDVSGYLHRLDENFIPDSVVAKMAKNLKGLPITTNPVNYPGKREYLKRSKRRLSASATKASQ